jgi:ethanolamine utilization protein EutN
MIIAEVIGNVVATQKDSKFEGIKLLLVRQLELDGSPKGRPFMAIDRIGAGEGETVLVVQEGKSSMQLMGRGPAPVDMAVVGIIDHYTVDGVTRRC